MNNTDTKFNADSTVTYWSTYHQCWVESAVSVPDRELAAMSREERDAVTEHLGLRVAHTETDGGLNGEPLRHWFRVTGIDDYVTLGVVMDDAMTIIEPEEGREVTDLAPANARVLREAAEALPKS